MGIRLIGQALLPDWACLSDRAHRVLIHMAYTAKDTASNGYAAATYWAGHEPLIIAVLGLDPDQLTRTELEVAQRKIKRAVQELKEAGAITLISSASRGRTAIYRIHPNPGESVDNSRTEDVQPEEWGSPSAPLSGHPVTPISEEWGSPRVRNGGHPVTPRGEHRGEQEKRGARQDPTQPAAQLSDARG